MKFDLHITDRQLHHIEENKKSYLQNPNTPKVVVTIREAPDGPHYTTEELVASPELMLKNLLRRIEKSLKVGCDYIPQIRVEFGTGQVAHAFGTGMYVYKDNAPCARGHVLDNTEDIENLQIPALDAGWFARAYEFTEYFMEHKPDWVGMEDLDLQGPFNNAHLIRGNDILTDFYDCPELVDMLLEKVTAYQIALINHYRTLTGMSDANYQYDWSALWKGKGRISNCSLHMISTDFYNDHIKKHDARLFEGVGGGRIHYCGTHDDGLVASLCSVPGLTGLDLDGWHHNLWDLHEVIPENIPLSITFPPHYNQRVRSGDIPKLKNLIVRAYAQDVEEGKKLYWDLKSALS